MSSLFRSTRKTYIFYVYAFCAATWNAGGLAEDSSVGPPDFHELLNAGLGLFFPDLSNQTADEIVHIYHFPEPKNTSNYVKVRSDMMNTTSFKDIKKNVPFKIFVHGFLADCLMNIFPLDLISAYSKSNEDMNLICIDWSGWSNPSVVPNPLLYPESIDKSWEIGEKLADILVSLRNESLVENFTDVHLIGMSLGAHIAGISASYISKKWNIDEKFGRITGLDPAGVFYRNNLDDLERRLDPNDAQFVDVIHTNVGQLGLGHESGHVDFYPNGGKIQPRCYRTTSLLFSWREQLSGECSHMISATYYKESIEEAYKKEPKPWIACKSSSWEKFLLSRDQPCSQKLLFGELVPKTANGTYYLEI